MSQDIIIDLRNSKVEVFSGYELGSEMSKDTGIKILKEGDKVSIILPDNTYALTSSFFRGMFENVFLKFENEHAFRDAVKFEGPAGILERIEILTSLTYSKIRVFKQRM